MDREKLEEINKLNEEILHLEFSLQDNAPRLEDAITRKVEDFFAEVPISKPIVRCFVNKVIDFYKEELEKRKEKFEKL